MRFTLPSLPPCRPRGRRFRRRADPSDGAARRHRPVGRGQDGVHHGAGAQSLASRPIAGVRGVRERANRARAARAAAPRPRRPPPLDIVDYPGEWLLDLPLLSTSYAQWSAEALILSRTGPREQLARDWHAHHATLDPDGREDEQAARAAARLFTDYLKACRSERYAMRLLPPGRFLMPGDLAGSPALTFAPLEVYGDRPAPQGSLWAMMERRYEAYKSVVVRPFFRDHFARLHRQIVLVDALA